MWWHDPRVRLLSALLLDWLGQLLILAVITSSWFEFPLVGEHQLEAHGLWFIFCMLLYPMEASNWLFQAIPFFVGVA